MTTTDTPLTGREIGQSWIIWGGTANSLGDAASELEAIAASHSADAVIAVRVVTVSETRTETGIFSGESIGTNPIYQAYGTAIRYV
ncbi:hypothetical protein BGM19_00570 [Streptomyces agglomeratus]|uniref:hypothetical protein n=1 Tax=Streptomyces agglomeratus TaxID=285458 RepID=UPI0008524D11|nr:hypothetical protein [Streptomyces agglomeratus]OEJ56771.1 hypothetical protein BGM19_00570 [Streptomyces agglomeratus]